MLADFDSILSQAISLPLPARYELTQRLLETFDSEVDIDAELIAEFDRRCADVDSGKVESIPFDQAMREIRDRLHES